LFRFTNDEIRSRTEQTVLTAAIRSRRLSILVISAALTPGRIIAGLSTSQGWHFGTFWGLDMEDKQLRTIENDQRLLNLGLATAKRRAHDRSAWRLLVTTDTSMTSS